MVKALELYSVVLDGNAVLGPGETMIPLADQEPHYLQRLDALQATLEPYKDEDIATPAVHLQCRSHLLSLRSCYVRKLDGLWKPWHEREQEIQRANVENAAQALEEIICAVDSWCRRREDIHQWLVVTLQLRTASTILYTKGRDEAMTRLVSIPERLPLGRHYWVRWVTLLGDTYCTKDGPPETMGLFVFPVGGEPRDLWETRPYQGLNTEQAALNYHRAMAIISAHEHNEPESYSRLSGDLLLRQAYLGFVTHSLATREDWEVFSTLFVIAQEAKCHFDSACDRLGSLISTAHSLIYHVGVLDQVGGFDDWSKCIEKVEEICQWSLEFGR